MPQGPLYRMLVYDDDDTTVLTPVAGAPHSNDFAVTSGAQHVDTYTYRPYLEKVKGRRGAINLFARTNDTGIGQVRLLDKRTTVGGSNLSRWVTAFLGDAKKKQRLIGKKLFIEESIDGGTTWTSYYTGYIAKLMWGPDRVWLSITIRDTRHIMKQEVFGELPHASLAASAYRPSLLPIGIVSDSNPAQSFGNTSNVSQITATVEKVGFGFMVLKDLRGVARARRLMHRHLEQLWDKLGRRTPTFGVADAGWPKLLRCNVRRISPSAIDDDFNVTAFDTDYSPFSGLAVKRVQVTNLVNIADPKSGYVGDFAADQTVYIHIWPDVDEPVSPDYPIFIDDVNHKEILRNLLDGKFGKLNADGSVRWTIPYNATDLTNDDTRPEARGIITGAEELEDVLSNWCQQYNYAWRVDEDGELRLISTKPPDATLSPPTITDADLADGGDSSWEVSDDSVVNEFSTTWYWDNHMNPEAISLGVRNNFAVPPGGVVFAPQTFRAVGGFSDHKPKPKAIDCIWLHASVMEIIFETRATQFKKAWAEGLGVEMLGPFGRGAHHISLRCRRKTTGGNPEGCVEGDWRIIDVDAVPDPSTNLRGGARLGRCVNRYNDGADLVLTFVDLGEDVALNVPTFTSVTQITGDETHAQRAAILQNAENDPVRVEISITTTGVGTRPTTGWHYVGNVTADGNHDVALLPADRRIWWRIRSEVTDGNRLRVPSTWVYPTTPAVGYVDTDPLGTPTGLTDSVTGTVATCEWTLPAGSDGLRVQYLIALDGNTLEVAATLPAGTERIIVYRLADGTPFVVSQIYDWGVRVLGAVDDEGPTATDTFTTAGTKSTAPDMLGPPLARSFGLTE